jgi:predicted RNase H-like HicB family nuclease
LRPRARGYGSGGRIPEIPGCVGRGASAEKAIADAAEALRDVAVHKPEAGFALPRRAPGGVASSKRRIT